MPHGVPWTEQEKTDLKAHFSHLPSGELAKAFPGRTPRALNDMAQRVGVKKSRERMAEMGRENSLVRWKRERDEGRPQAG